VSNEDILYCIYGAVVLLAFIVGYLTGRNRGYNKGWAIGFDTRSSIMDTINGNR